MRQRVSIREQFWRGNAECPGDLGEKRSSGTRRASFTMPDDTSGGHGGWDLMR